MSRLVIISFFALAIMITGCIRKNEPIRKTNIKSSAAVKELNNVPAMNEILFTGMMGNKPGIYKYNFSTKSYAEFWHNNKEEVIELSYSADKKAAFLITAHQYGKKGVFPFINNIKLYSIGLDSNTVKLVEAMGNGLQIFSFWENDNSFKVIINIFNVTVGKYFEQIIKTFDASGKKLKDEKKTYDVVKDGFPQTPVIQKNITSSDKRYSILSVDSAGTQIYLIDHAKNDEKNLITKLYQKLNVVDWSEDGEYLFFSTIDISPGNETLYSEQPATSKLFIYSLVNKKVVKIFDGGGIKNFMRSGNILILDDGFKERSKLLIYNFRSGQMIDSVKVSGGCGLKNIPRIPDYGA
jgi:hypothetical protein